MYESESDTEKEDSEYQQSSGARSTKAGPSPHKHGGYRIKNVLKVPRPTTYTTQAIYEQIHGSDINLEPEYQRDVVWPEVKQVGLIDSIFRNFYIPPVIFAVNQFEDGSETKTCIDGKQRLTSIYRFMDGLIYYKDPFTNEKLWYRDVETASNESQKTILPEKYRRLFANKQIVCIEYQDITDDAEREIFQRVQLGMALTPAEKLQAIKGPMPTFIRELNATYIKCGGLDSNSLDWDRSRGGDFRCFAQALYIIEKFAEEHVNYSTLLQLENWLARSPDPAPEFREKVHNTYRVFVDLAHDANLKEAFGPPTRISPIEFVMISLLISVHKDQLTPTQLSVAIGLMRADARDKHVDIRMNGRIAKTMIEFIRGYKANRHDNGEATSVPAGTKRKHSRMDADVDMRLPVPPEKGPSNSSQPARSNFDTSGPGAPPTDATSILPPEKHNGAVIDRLAAIRAAKDKNTSPPVPIPSNNAAALRINSLPSSIQVPHNSNPLENGLMAKMSSRKTAGSRERGNKPTRSRYSSPEGNGQSRSTDRTRGRDRGLDSYRDRDPRRSVSSERSIQSRTRRPYDGTRDWDYKSHQGRHREYPDRDSKWKT